MLLFIFWQVILLRGCTVQGFFYVLFSDCPFAWNERKMKCKIERITVKEEDEIFGCLFKIWFQCDKHLRGLGFFAPLMLISD